MSDKEPLRIALVGCGRIAKKHLQAIRFQERKGRACLLAVADQDPARAEALLRQVYGRAWQQAEDSRNLGRAWQRNKSPKIYSGLTQLLTAEKPDILAITTPSGSHYAMALEGLQAGCHLLVEKPLAMSLAEGKEIAKVQAASGKQVALGHIYRYMPVVALLQADLAQGRFGRIYYGTVQVRWGHDQAYYDQAAWRGTRKADGGVIMNQSIHALDLARWMLGASQSEILACQGMADRQSHQIESEDLGLGLFHFANDTYLNFEASTSTDPAWHEANLFIAAEKAEIRLGLQGKHPHLSVRKEGKELAHQYIRKYLSQLIGQDGWRALPGLGNPHQAIYSDLLAAIREDRPPLADLAAGLQSLEMVEALYAACGIPLA